MHPKQNEMDGIVKVIYETLQKRDEERCTTSNECTKTLLVLCSDHGMNEVKINCCYSVIMKMGNHGGASYGEMAAFALFASDLFANKAPSFTARVVPQVDVCPTISAALGIPIPRNNLGSILSDVLNWREGLFLLFNIADCCQTIQQL